MSILIITHSDDNDSVSLVAEAIASKGGHTIRFDTDRYPTEVRLSAYYGKAGDERLTLTNEEGELISRGNSHLAPPPNLGAESRRPSTHNCATLPSARRVPPLTACSPALMLSA